MKAKYNFLISLICWGILLYLYIFNFNIISNTLGYLFILIIFGTAGWNLGTGISKSIK